MKPTLDEIRRRGLEVLVRELGKSGMIRFVQQFDSSSGDYARERHAWVDATSLDDIRAASNAKKRPKK